MLKLLFVLLVGGALTGGAMATEIVGRAAYGDESFGQQSDASTGTPYVQSFVAPSGTVLEAIRWWGFHGADSLGPSFDNFVVTLDGVPQTGVLSVASASAFFDEYTLDIPDALLTASTLSITNDSGDVEWFWQSASAVGNAHAPDAAAVAFSLIGHRDEFAVDEPAIASMVGLGLAVLTLAGRRKPSA